MFASGYYAKNYYAGNYYSPVSGDVDPDDIPDGPGVMFKLPPGRALFRLPESKAMFKLPAVENNHLLESQ